MMLLVDVGNTRIKWATCDDGGLQLHQAEAHAKWSLDDVHRHITQRTQLPNRIVVSNVAGPRMQALLTDATLEAWGLRPKFVHSTAFAGGVRSAYAEPTKLGVDRWAGMIAAHNSVSGTVCVVSVGTAMTVDGVDGEGQHLGGLITPGPQLMVQALLGGTSDIADRFRGPPLSDEVFSSDTASAVHNGARHALAALVVRASEWTSERTGQKPAVILTGGASGALDALLPYPCQSVPDLVLRGLIILAGDG